MSRVELLNKLITMQDSVDTIVKNLEKYRWDVSEELVLFEKKHMLNILCTYLKGKITELEVENWANAIESREDIEIEICSKRLINEIIYELANPYLTEKLTKDRAKDLYNKLNSRHNRPLAR